MDRRGETNKNLSESSVWFAKNLKSRGGVGADEGTMNSDKPVLGPPVWHMPAVGPTILYVVVDKMHTQYAIQPVFMTRSYTDARTYLHTYEPFLPLSYRRGEAMAQLHEYQWVEDTGALTVQVLEERLCV